MIYMFEFTEDEFNVFHVMVQEFIEMAAMLDDLDEEEQMVLNVLESFLERILHAQKDTVMH